MNQFLKLVQLHKWTYTSNDMHYQLKIQHYKNGLTTAKHHQYNNRCITNHSYELIKLPMIKSGVHWLRH